MSGKVALVAVGAIGLFGYWVFNQPAVSAEHAKTECTRFANENLKTNLYNNVRAMDTWSKNGKRVVELGYFETKDAKSYMPRICVVGDGKIQIVSILENGMWRQ